MNLMNQGVHILSPILLYQPVVTYMYKFHIFNNLIEPSSKAFEKWQTQKSMKQKEDEKKKRNTMPSRIGFIPLALCSSYHNLNSFQGFGNRS